MKHTLARIVAAAALLAASQTSLAANVTLTGWAYGNGNNVQATGYSGPAGGYIGALSGAGVFDASPFITYCIELAESFSFSSSAMTGYSVVDGAEYFQRRHGDTSRAENLGRLLTFVADNPGAVSTAAQSTSMQLAVWNLVYETDYSVTLPGGFSDTSSYRTYANTLLAGAQGVTQSRYNVFALERSGKQDFMVASLRPSNQQGRIPEPTSLALALLGLAGVAGSCRAAAGKRRSA